VTSEEITARTPINIFDDFKKPAQTSRQPDARKDTVNITLPRQKPQSIDSPTITGFQEEPQPIQQKEERRPRRKKLAVRLALALALTLAVIGGMLAFLTMTQKSNSKQDALSMEGEGSQQPALPKPVTPAPSPTQPERSSMDVFPHEPVPAAQPAAPVSPDPNADIAVEIVKTHPLPDGKGVIASWFQNSFMSQAAPGTREEWSAKFLHNNSFVVQYKLARPRAEPVIYLFEVDVNAHKITRGINNAAIELLSTGARPAARTSSRRSTPRRKTTGARRITRNDGGIPQLPLPKEGGRKINSSYGQEVQLADELAGLE
jgi:hypothetical protein